MLVLVMLVQMISVFSYPSFFVSAEAGSSSVTEATYDFEVNADGWSGKWGTKTPSVAHSADLSRSGNTGALRVDVDFDGGDYESAVIGFATDLKPYDKVEYDLYIPAAFKTSADTQFKAETGANSDWLSLGGMDTYIPDTLTKETINGVEYGVIHRSSLISGITTQTDLILQFAAYKSTYAGPIYVDNVKLTAEQVTSGPAQELASYTFDNDLQGWSADPNGEYQAEFGSPPVEHSTFNGGALRLNAILSDPSKDWQELRIFNSVNRLDEGKKLTFETYLSLDDLADEYEAKLLKPYIVLDPDWTKILGTSDKKISDMEKVTIDGKEYAKQTVSIILGSAAGKSSVYIGFVAGGISYNGPVYIDNIKLFDKAVTGGGVTPVVVPDGNQPAIDTSNFDLSDITIADANATPETKSLFAYLRNVRGKSLLFGQQHATTQGLTISTGNGTESDVKNAVGDFPAVYGWDTLSLEGKEEPGNTGNNLEQNTAALVEVMKQAYQRNGIITLSAHMPNFYTGGDSWDSTPGVEAILPGGSHNAEFNAFLDKIAYFAGEAKEGNTLIPIIFRPFHENTGSWFWWGASQSTPAQYISLYRYTVEYLRDEKGVRNFLYAYSPNNSFDEDSFLKRYPGDAYVDIIGFDAYDSVHTQAWIDGLVQDAATLAKMARERGKVAALTEVGLKQTHASGDSGLLIEDNVNKEWFTQVLSALKNDPDAKESAFILTWRNGGASHFWTPYRDHSSYGSHEMLDDFTTFYNDPYTGFNQQLQNVYSLLVNAQPNAPFLNVHTPYNGQKITGPLKIRAGVYNKPVASVTFSINGEAPAPLTLSPNGYYEAEWVPGIAQNGKEAEVTVTVTYTDNQSASVTNKVKIFAGIPLKVIEFTDGLEDAEFEGTYPENLVSGTITHNTVVGGGSVQADVQFADEGTSSDWTYQEVKVKLPGVDSGIDMSQINRIEYDILLPSNVPDSTAFKPYASLSGTELFLKIGEGAVQINKPDFTEEGGLLRYRVSIPFDSQPGATDITLNFVANDWAYDGTIYFDNVSLQNYVEEPPGDPALVDDFEGYGGDNDQLSSAYSTNGDAVALTLDQERAKQGVYALKYQYTLSSNGYAGRILPLGTRDWSSYDKLRLNMTPDGQGQKLVIQIKANGIEFEAFPSLASTQEAVLEIPFEDFIPKTAGQVLSGDNLKKVQHFAIYVNAQGAPVSGGTLYFDNIRAVSSSDPGNGGNPGNPGNPSDGSSGQAGGSSGVIADGTKVVDMGNEISIQMRPVTGTSAGGRNQVTYDIDAESMEKALKMLKDKEGKVNSIVIPVDFSSAAGINVILTGESLANTLKEQPNAAITVKSGEASYQLPLHVIDLQAIAKELGVDAGKVKISISMEKVSDDMHARIAKAVGEVGAKLIGSSIDFRVTAEADGRTMEIKDFGRNYVTRTIVLTEPVDGAHASVVLFDPVTGELSFVPATFAAIDGKTHAAIKRNGNSIYAIIQNDKTFVDIQGHWAREEIELLASKTLINGIGADRFNPNGKVTRAQFATMLVQSLGLSKDASAAAQFKDIKPSDWFAGVTGAAVKAELISGFSDGTFRPNQEITRQEMAVMLDNALRFLNKEHRTEGNEELILTRFADRSTIASWAEDAAARAVDGGLMLGLKADIFAPRQSVTRAEAAVIIKRLLVKAEFINE